MAPTFTYSKLWSGRRFRLSQNTISWGRFSVEDSHYSELSEDARSQARRRFREVNPQLIADAFEHLLRLQKPESLNSFTSEMHVLAAYEFSKHSLASAPGRKDSALEDKPNNLISESLNAALVAVIQSARAIQDDQLEFISYAPTLASPYSAVFRSRDGYYNAVFDSELVLKSVHQRNEECQVWPLLSIGSRQPALMANLL